MTGLFVLALLAAAGAFWFAWRQRSAYRKAANRLREVEARLAETQHLARIGTWEFDLRNDAICWSEETFRIFGFAPGTREPDFADILLSVDPQDAPVFDHAIQRAITEHEAYRLDLRIRTPGGSQKYVHAQGSPVLDRAGEVERIIGTVLDITERKSIENQLAQEAVHDPLTGLANRRYLLLQLEHAVAEARRHGDPVTLCICDVDHFKGVNDTYGHLIGDDVLKEFGKTLSDEVRQSDVAGRLGGDEFCIVFPKTPARYAKVSIERVRTRLRDREFSSADGRQFKVTATFGLAEFQTAMDAKALIDAADHALYEAKQSGRNRVSISADAPGLSA